MFLSGTSGHNAILYIQLYSFNCVSHINVHLITLEREREGKLILTIVITVISPLTKLYSYTQNGILQMLDRNRRIKPSPERFQEANGDVFNIIFTVGEKIFDTVVEGK